MSLGLGAYGGFSNSSADRWAASSGVFANRIGNIGCRIFGGRMAWPVTLASNTTFEMLVGIPCDVEAVQIVFANGYNASASAPATVYAMAAAVPSPVLADVNAAAWVQATYGNSANLAAALTPATATQNRKISLSDWIPIQSVARNDGGTMRLVAVRAMLTACTLNMLNSAAGDTVFTNWASHPSGRIVRFRQQAFSGGVPASAGNWTSTTDQSGKGPIVGIRYLAKGKVINIAGFGDSITEGQGTYKNEGFGFPACVELTNEDRNGIVYEWSNLGWSGSQMAITRNLARQAVADGLAFNAAIVPNGSPNNLSVPMTAAEISTMRGDRALGAAALMDGRTPVIPWTMLPISPTQKDWGSSDSLRRSLNDAWRAAAEQGQMLMDFDALASGEMDGDGQVLPKAGFMADGIHPSDAGNALLVPLVKTAIKRTVGASAGSLVA